MRALISDKIVCRTGDWCVPKASAIGYLDQHYSNLNKDFTVLEQIKCVMPNANYAELRKVLATFLFRKNEEVDCKVEYLSGGEKARLSLSGISVRPPELLILDEMTNNLDKETREHVIQVLQNFPGAMIVVSHDDDFLSKIGVNDVIDIEKMSCSC